MHPPADLSADPVLACVHTLAQSLCSAAANASRHSGPRAVDALDCLMGAVVDAMGDLQDAAELDAACRDEEAREAYCARTGFRPDAFDRAMGWSPASRRAGRAA